MAENEKEFFQLHSKITEAKSLFREKLKQLLKGGSLKDAEQRLKGGRHLVDFEKVNFPEEQLRKLFDDFYAVLKGFEFHEVAEVETLKAAVEAGELNWGSLVKKTYSGDPDFLSSLGERLGVSVDLLTYLGTNLGNPFFEMYAGRLRGKVELKDWLRGSCPLCGSEAAFARLKRDDGKRILWCQFCGTEWGYPRIKCPFCATENHKKLRYLFTEEEKRYRVYLCDECKRYIKTIDEREVQEDEKPDLSFENLKTLYLDILAEKDGYRGQKSWEKGSA
ncbi:MAG: formate dehydrogenase accessory protein FdhE [Candidatus Zixiibacteriota bacterium]